MDLKGLVETMVQGGAFTQVVNNPLAQFGTAPVDYPFADLLPEQTVPVNEFTEEGIRYRTLIANAGTRYSPVQIKRGAIVGSFRVSLGFSDIGDSLTSSDYDAIIRALERFTGTAGTPGAVTQRPMMEAVAQVTQWADKSLNQPLLVHNELQRAQALISAQIILVGDNGFREVINLPNPSGARVTAGGTWSNDTYDPWPDIIARVNYLKNKGYQVNRIWTSTAALTILRNNAKVKARAGIVSIVSAVVTGLPGAVTMQQLNDMAQRDGLPPFEANDRVYFTSLSFGFYFARDTMLFLCTTGRDQRIERGDLEPVVKFNTLGYTAIGRAAGQSGPGRVLKIRPEPDTKPPRIDGEGWQASLAIVTDPEAVSVITGIA